MRKTRVAILLLSVFFSVTCLSQVVSADDVSASLNGPGTSLADPDFVDLAAQDPAEYIGVPYSFITSLPDGGQAYNFNAAGASYQVLVPPPNFKPLKATDEQLIKYGFGARPTDPTQLAQWTADMKNYKKTITPKKMFLGKSKIDTTLTGTADVIGHTPTSIWAGYLAIPAPSGNYGISVYQLTIKE